MSKENQKLERMPKRAPALTAVDYLRLATKQIAKAEIAFGNDCPSIEVRTLVYDAIRFLLEAVE